jgi:hypothetical protein
MERMKNEEEFIKGKLFSVKNSWSAMKARVI